MLQNFRTYQTAKELYRSCEALCLKGEMKNQLERASLSIVLNLAEGSGKPSCNERKRFYGIALGSIREVQAILDLLGRTELFQRADQLGAMTYTLIRKTK